MDLKDVLSDTPIPVRTEVEESATDDKPEVAETPEPAEPSSAKEQEKPAETPAEAEARVRDEKGRFSKTVPHEAFHAEKAKRRELEQKLQELQAQKPTSVLEDEDKAFTERLSKATQPLMERFFKLSVKTARTMPGRDDYEDMASAFTEAAEADPKLWDEFKASDDPGEYVYHMGKQYRELGEVGGDILKYGEKKRAEGAAEVDSLKQQIAALNAEISTLKGSKDKQARIPQSLNSEQSATTKGGEAFTGPTPLKSIING